MSGEVEFRNYSTVEVIEQSGNDGLISRAARVSTGTDLTDLGIESVDGLLGYLLRNRHGSPFEHGSVTFRVETPIFVAREFMRHRIGFSYNETSGRYRVLDPVFYIPPPDRALVQVGKPGEYRFEPGDKVQHTDVSFALRARSLDAWRSYENLRYAGVANEVARMCLPVNIFTSFYVTCNPRSLMNFLSLRTQSEHAAFRSTPQWEIQEVAQFMEEALAFYWPLTHAHFDKNGRVAP